MKPINSLLAAGVAIITVLGSFDALATTYTWDQQALGQEYQHCLNINAQYWPSNNLWSQSYATNSSCSGGVVTSAPSNWDPWLPIGVYPGGPGAVGVDVVIGGLVNGVPTASGNTYLGEVLVTVNRLTLQTNGSLNIGLNVSVTANTIDIQRDTVIGPGEYAGAMYVATGGTLTKSGGTGTLGFGQDGYGNAVGFQAVNAGLVVKSGTFAMPYKGGGRWFGGTFSISNNAFVLLNVDSDANPSLCDTITGIGSGTVVMNGTVRTYGYDFYGNSHNGLTLNFPGTMFQWSGGSFVAGGPVTNAGVLNLTNAPYLQATLFNNGTLNLADKSSFGLGGQTFYNGAGGTFNLMGNASVAGAGGNLWNYGLLKKAADTGRSQIFPVFHNYGGTVEVDSGTLAVGLGSSGNAISNATFIVQNGATLDLSISNYTTRISGVLTGSGGGTVFMNNGSVFCDSLLGAATLDFPGAMFQWAGGTLGGESSTFLTNAGTINLSGPVAMDIYFANNGTIIQSGAGDNGGNGAQLANNVGGVYQIQNDNGVAINYFNNSGLLAKTGGSGTSVIRSTFNNSGAIQATSGTLLFTGGAFNQNAGTLQITPAITFTNQPFYLNGGMVTGVGTVGDNLYAEGGVLAPGNPFGTLAVNEYHAYGGLNCTLNIVLGGTNQFSQLAAGNASLDGTLNVTLTNGYVPAIGTQFQIISCLNRSGGFATLNVPQGISVNYSNSGVYLLVVGPVAAQLQSPQVSGGNFTFSFGTTNGLGYTVLQNTNLATTNWTYYTNLIGKESLYQFTTPVTNIPQRFFRVSQP